MVYKLISPKFCVSSSSESGFRQNQWDIGRFPVSIKSKVIDCGANVFTPGKA